VTGTKGRGEGQCLRRADERAALTFRALFVNFC
jgi:hypothetical protein